MSRRHTRVTQDARVVVVLIERAKELATGLGHTMGPFASAKRWYGKGALNARCVNCQAQVLVLPHGAWSGSHDPIIMHEAVFEVCHEL